MSRKFLLDANTFIEAKDRYYGFDICPGFWASLLALHKSKRVFSIDRIQEELTGHDDNLKDWVNARVPETFFKKTEDLEVIETYRQMMNWVYSQPQFTDAARSDFASGADGWLIAYAAVNQLVVVTHEQFAPDAKSRVKIPNVCMEYAIEWVDTFATLREVGAKFVRSKKRAST